MRTRHGFSLLELLLVISLLGILLALSAPLLRNDRFAVSQAAQALSSQVVRARLEALRRNTGVGLRVDHTTQQYFLFVDSDGSYTYSSGDTTIGGTTITFGQSSLAAVRLGTSATLVFDARGFLRDATSVTLITVNNQSQSFRRQVQVSVQGRSVLL